MIKMECYFAGGCFWCITPVFYDINGVEKVISGFSGGDEVNPTYEDVKHQLTNHRETIKIIYDENKVSYKELLECFLTHVDLFDGEGQYIDRGRSYTLAVYYLNEKEKEEAINRIKEIETMVGKKTFISIEPFKSFYEADSFHQDYYKKNPIEFEKELVESGRKK